MSTYRQSMKDRKKREWVGDYESLVFPYIIIWVIQSFLIHTCRHIPYRIFLIFRVFFFILFFVFVRSALRIHVCMQSIHSFAHISHCAHKYSLLLCGQFTDLMHKYNHIFQSIEIQHGHCACVCAIVGTHCTSYTISITKNWTALKEAFNKDGHRRFYRNVIFHLQRAVSDSHIASVWKRKMNKQRTRDSKSIHSKQRRAKTHTHKHTQNEKK